MNIQDVTSITVSCLLLELIQGLFEGIQKLYPGHKFIIVDNGSHNESTDYILELGKLSYVKVIINDRNVGHGPGMNQAMELVETPLVFTWDTDVIVHRSGFLEAMIKRFEGNPKLLACGDAHVGYGRLQVPCVLQYAMMMSRGKYLQCSPFAHHGATGVGLFQSAQQLGLKVEQFPISDYVTHLRGVTMALLGTWRAGAEATETGQEKLINLPEGQRWTDQHPTWIKAKSKGNNSGDE